MTARDALRAPWWAVNSPMLSSLGSERRARNQAAIVERAESILAKMPGWTSLDCCFALESAASQLRDEGRLL